MKFGTHKSGSFYNIQAYSLLQEICVIRVVKRGHVFEFVVEREQGKTKTRNQLQAIVIKIPTHLWA